MGDFFADVPKRPLRAGEVPAIGQVVYSDGVTEYVLLDQGDNDAVRQMMASHCEECARSVNGQDH